MANRDNEKAKLNDQSAEISGYEIRGKKRPTKSIGHYIIGKTIGEGTFGKVKLGTHILTGDKVAVKILEKERITDVADVERVSREIHILKLIRHPNIIQLYEIIETPKQLYLIMEYANGGELFDYIVKKHKIEENEACKFFQQIISGIEYIHKLKIVHRDMKPENLLLDHNNQIKIVDFGLSNTFKDNELLKTAWGSPCYASPEMIAGKAYVGPNADIWSWGIILYALVWGFLPFEDQNTATLYKKILAGEFTLPDFISRDVKELIIKILVTDPEKRYKVNEIRDHSWFSSSTPILTNEGIIIGYDQIPIETSILKMMGQFGFEAEYTEKWLDANKHNIVTTTYYLFLKRLKKEGKLKCEYEAVNQLKDRSVDRQQFSVQKKIEYENAVLDSISKFEMSNKNILNPEDDNIGNTKLQEDKEFSKTYDDSRDVPQLNQSDFMKTHIRNKCDPINDTGMIYINGESFKNKIVTNGSTQEINPSSNHSPIICIAENCTKSFDNRFGYSQILQNPIQSERLNSESDNRNNYTELYDNKNGNLNLSCTLTQDNQKETSTQEIIWKELFYARKMSRRGQTSERVKNKLNTKYSDSGRSVISSDNDIDSSHRRNVPAVKEKPKFMFQSHSSKTGHPKKFMVKKSALHSQENKGFLSGTKEYKVNRRLAGILEKQLNVLMANAKPSSTMKFDREEQKSQFLPYKDISKLQNRQNRSRSQRSKRNLTVSNSEMKERGRLTNISNSSNRSNYIHKINIGTPRYRGNKIRLVKGQEKTKRPLLKAQNNTGWPPRHVKSSGLRSNCKRRPSQGWKLTEHQNPCNYTQDQIKKNKITDKSHSISHDTANISLASACKARRNSKKSKLSSQTRPKNRLTHGRYSHNVSKLEVDR